MMSPATAKDGAAGQAGDPHNAQQYYQRGLAEAQSGQNAAAIADFEQSILLDPNRFEAYQKLDDLLSAQRQWPTIIQYWSQYIQLHPNDGRAHCERGGTYSQLHDAPHTLADAEKGCSLGIATCCQALRNFQARQPPAAPPASGPATGPPTGAWPGSVSSIVHGFGRVLIVLALAGLMTILICVWVFRDPARAYRVMTGKALPDFTPHKAVTLAQTSGWTLPPELAQLPPRTVQIKPLAEIRFFMVPAIFILLSVVFIDYFFHFVPPFHESDLKNMDVRRAVYVLCLPIGVMSLIGVMSFAALRSLRSKIRLFGFAKDLMEMGTATRGVITYLHVYQGRYDREPSTVQYQFIARDNQVRSSAPGCGPEAESRDEKAPERSKRAEVSSRGAGKTATPAPRPLKPRSQPAAVRVPQDRATLPTL
jgi:hypothetical protein